MPSLEWESTLQSRTIESMKCFIASTDTVAPFCVQILARVLVRCSLHSSGVITAQKRIFISPLVLDSFLPVQGQGLAQATVLRRCGAAVCERVFEGQLEACTSLLQRTEEAGAVRRCLGIISEVNTHSTVQYISCNQSLYSMPFVHRLSFYCDLTRRRTPYLQWALATGLLGLQRPCDVIIATLCRFTVPRWHGQELLTIDLRHNSSASGVGIGRESGELFRWRHVQAVVRLLQVVHVLSDVITDWDAVMDCFEQLLTFISSPKSQIHEDVTALEFEKIAGAIDRFKQYTIFLSDESLVRVMASLVALSLNSLAATAQSSNANANPNSSGLVSSSGLPGVSLALPRPPGPGSVPGVGMGSSSPLMSPSSNYPSQAQMSGDGPTGSGNVTNSFSLQAAVEVTKVNAYRVACVWQMVTSHLRMVATHKSSEVRLAAVRSTHDVIAETLEFMRSPLVPPINMVSELGG